MTIEDQLYAPLEQDAAPLTRNGASILAYLRTAGEPRTIGRIGHDLAIPEIVVRAAMKQLEARQAAVAVGSRRLFVATSLEDSTE